MKSYLKFILSLFLISFCYPITSSAQMVSTKKERNLIDEGNKFYKEGNFNEAEKKYKAAMKENPQSAVAQYNLALSQLRLGSNPNDTTRKAQELLGEGLAGMEKIAKLGNKKANLASRANYNIGNVAFSTEDYNKALNYYKQALRLNPDDEDARRNLRITQLKIKEQDQDQNQDQNQDKEQNQDQQQDQNQDQEQNQDKQDQDNQNNQDQQQDQDQSPQQPQINPQTAEQILNAMENKEAQTRARVGNEQSEKARQRNKSRYNW